MQGCPCICYFNPVDLYFLHLFCLFLIILPSVIRSLVTKGAGLTSGSKPLSCTKMVAFTQRQSAEQDIVSQVSKWKKISYRRTRHDLWLVLGPQAWLVTSPWSNTCLFWAQFPQCKASFKSNWVIWSKHRCSVSKTALAVCWCVFHLRRLEKNTAEFSLTVIIFFCLRWYMCIL